MKKASNLLFLICFMFCNKNFGQETFKKTYKISNTIYYGCGSKTSLKKTIKIKFENLAEKEQDSIKKTFPKYGSTISYITEKNISGKK